MEFFRALAEILGKVEEASRTSGGAMALVEKDSGERVGRVMAENGRVCWVTARDSSPSLGERIAKATGEPLDRLRALYQRCKEQERPLGEALVSQGLLDGERLRELLAEQSAHCLASLVRASLNGSRWETWAPVPSSSYQPDYTFTTTEMVRSILTHDLEAAILAPPVPEPFSEEVARQPMALCLLMPDGGSGHGLPVAASKGLDLSLEDCHQLARQALRLLRPPTLLAAGIKPLFTLSRQATANTDSPNTTPGVAVARSRHHLLIVHYPQAMAGVPLVAAMSRRRRLGEEG